MGSEDQSPPGRPAAAAGRLSGVEWMLLAGWAVLLALALALPALTRSTNPADDMTRYTVRVALLYYAVAAAGMLRLSPDQWRTRPGAVRVVRWLWTLAWGAYLVHLAVAFGYYHGGSHADALRHTRAVSGFGEGIYVSHAFTLLWTLDVAWWWLAPARYRERPAPVGGCLHGFMAFIVFCATVVYEQGPIRWTGLAGFAIMGCLLTLRLGKMGVGKLNLRGNEP